MNSWITYARPFAYRRMIYREKEHALLTRSMDYRGEDSAQREYLDGRWQGAQWAREGIEILWAEFRDQVLNKPTLCNREPVE